MNAALLHHHDLPNRDCNLYQGAEEYFVFNLAISALSFVTLSPRSSRLNGDAEKFTFVIIAFMQSQISVRSTASYAMNDPEVL
jgi:hypothetical protein